MVQAGQLESGDRLPASRVLAEELSVSRLTVVTAYDQLVSEGYLVGRRGAGMYIAPDLAGLPRPPSGPKDRTLPVPERVRPFDSAVPDADGFPHRQWARLFDLIWRKPDPALLGRPDPLGWGPLRTAIAQHLQDWRGIDCAPTQIVVTSGLGEALDLISRGVLPAGGAVAVEEPGHGALRAALHDNGMQVVPIPVDNDGFDPGLVGAKIRAVAVTPSRQFPLGMTLPLARRLRLLQWARETGGWVIEDDYDGEYRYRGQPLPAMMSLDDAGRVLYAGSFSKVMFQGLRLAYLVLPEALVDPVRAEMERSGARAAIPAQPVLARFMEDGTFATHLRRMRRLYAHRQKALVQTLERDCHGLLEAEEGPAGMHIVATMSPSLRARMNDVEASRKCREAGVTARPLSAFFAGSPTRQGVVLGFAGFSDAQMQVAAKAMRQALS